MKKPIDGTYGPARLAPLKANKTNQKKNMKLKAFGFTFTVEFHADENEYCATFNGFSGYGRTQERAIAVCYGMMKETFQGEDED